MRKITIEGLNIDNNSILIDKFKLLFGLNDNLKFNMRNCIKKYFDKEPKLEFDIEKNIKNNLQMNDRYIDLKRVCYFELDGLYDIKEDIKLGTKSILQKYYEYLLDKIEYNDLFISLNSLLKALIEDIGLRICVNDLKVNGEIIELTKKAIIKMIETRLMKNDLEISPLSLDYEEVILLQLNMIKSIAERDYEKEYIVILNIPLLSKKVFENIVHKIENLHIFVFTYFLKDCIDIDFMNVAIIEDNIYDLSNDDQLYEMTLSLNINISISELREKLLKKHIKIIKEVAIKEI